MHYKSFLNKTVSLILNSLMISGGIVIAITAPNLFKLLAGVFNYDQRFTSKQLENSCRYLKSRGYVRIEKKNNKSEIRLTLKGQKQAGLYKIRNLSLNHLKDWDGRWRIVFFDVPERLNGIRRKIVQQLRRLGFRYLQKSVWVVPWPCESEIKLLAEYYEILEHINLAEVTQLMKEGKLKKYFGLK